MSDLIERLRAHAALHRGLGFDDDDEQVQWARDLLTAAEEIERLTASLKRANETAEHFERHWYLRGDEIERLTAALRAQPGPVNMDDMEWAGKVHLAEAIRERDEARAERDALAMTIAAERKGWIDEKAMRSTGSWGPRSEQEKNSGSR